MKIFKTSINLSPAAKDLLNAAEEYIEISSRSIYCFTVEEQKELERMIQILNNQINILIDYELKKRGQ